ncbi:MAG: glycine cleavage system protein T, partial [Microbacterium arborescens]
MSDPRSTVLHHRHAALGASFTDFGGWLMPVRYTSDLAEHHAVRSAAGLFDISHMAEFEVTGPVAGDCLDVALAGLVSAMPIGKAKYSLVLAADGGIIDDVIVYRLGDERFLIIANAGNREAVWAALQQRSEGWDVELRDLTDAYALLAVQGPAALSVLEATSGLSASGVALADTRYYAWAAGEFSGEPVLLARTGYTGEDGFE